MYLKHISTEKGRIRINWILLDQLKKESIPKGTKLNYRLFSMATKKIQTRP